MIIERTEKPGKEYYEEVVNLLAQYKKIIKNPTRKVLNSKYICIFGLSVAAAYILYMVTLIACGLHCTWYLTLINIIDGVLALLLAFRLIWHYRSVNTYLKRTGKTVYTLDENQIQVENQYATYKMPWENVLEARVLRNSINLIGNERQPLIISFEKKDGLLVFNYMKRNNIQVLTVE